MKLNRRNAVKSILAGLALAPVLGVNSIALAASKLKKVIGLDKPGGKAADPRAAGFKFYSNYKKVPKKLTDEKAKQTAAMNPKKHPQKCEHCVLFSGKNLEEKGYGKCLALFQNDLIANEGWCNSWSPRQS